jgi:Glucose / Sorbosone dehydrogenase
VRRSALHIAHLVVAVTLLSAVPATGSVRLIRVGTFIEPVYVTAPGGDTSRVFVVERGGRIRILIANQLLPQPYLDIRQRVSQADGPGDERGLMSMAFAPDFARSGRFYVYYTTPTRRHPKANNVVLDEYHARPDATQVDPATRRQVLMLPGGHQHFGGQIAFGPDGFLWVGPGDGRGPGDPQRRAQNLSRMHGKILRINPRATRGLGVQNNPFAGRRRGKLVWASGLRNPYRFSFDRVTGDLSIGDVGQNVAEEIDFVSKKAGLGKGANFGWSLLEGRYRFRRDPTVTLRPARRRELPPRYVAPAIEHLHSRGWCAVVGGYVVRDPALPDLAGRYVYGDFCRGRINIAVLRDGQRSVPKPLGLTVPLLSSFGEDGCGRVYVTSLNGPVYRLGTSGRCAGPAPTPWPTPPGLKQADPARTPVVEFPGFGALSASRTRMNSAIPPA